ncbi:retrovirus-related pol polyprotein from transposon TNT 1-94 [Tanacetum coccineum]
MLDRTDFASWQQRIQLYCQGKVNGVNILKSIDEGPSQMGTIRDPIAEGTEDRYNADIRATNILLQGLPKGIYTLINHYTEAKDIWDNVKMLLEGSELTKEDRESQLYDDFEHFRQNKGETIHDYYVRFTKLINDMRNIKMTMSRMQLNSKFVNNMLPEWGRFVTAVKLNRGLRDSNYDQLYAYLKQHEAHTNENKMMLDRFTQHTGRHNRGQGKNARGAGVVGYGGAQNRVGNANLGQARQIKCYNCNADECDAFDSDVDEAPTAQTMFMANLSSADPVYDEAGPSYDSTFYLRYTIMITIRMLFVNIMKYTRCMTMYNQTTVSTHILIIRVKITKNPYDHNVKDNTVPVVQSNVSYVPNDAYMMILNDIYEQSAQCVSVTTQNNVVDNSLTAELAIYKEQVELKYERKLHSVKLQLTSTINHNKSMVEEVTSLKKDFKQKENKYLEEFLDMKALKEKVEDKLYKQDQSLQTVHMLCKPKPYYHEHNKVAIGYKNPLCLTRAKQVQPALYNGHEIIKTNHVPAIVHNSEDTLEIAEITRKKMNDKMKDPENFEGIQKALTKEIKEIKEIFKELEAEVDQNVVNRKHDEIECKNLLFANDNLIVDCLSKEVFYIAMNSELTVSRFTEMHVAHTVVQARCLELEAELSKLLDKVQKDDHTELIKNVMHKVKKVWIPMQVKQVCKATGKVLTSFGYQWRPTGRTFTLGEQFPLTRLTKPKVVPAMQTENVVQIVLWYLDSGCSKHMMRDHSRLRNFMKKFIETVRFGNDHFGAIMSYGDYVIGDSVISSHSCYLRDTDGVELIKGSRGSNLYTISVEDMMKSSPICLKDLVRGLPRLKFEKDHLCSACQPGKSKKHTHTPKAENTNLEVLNTLHMDLCGPMGVKTINGKKYILVIVDDYSRTPQQNGIVERWNRTLVEATRTMLIFSKAPMFLWAEAVATASYTQNRSLIHTLHNKTPYELVHDKKPDLTFF